MKNILILEGSTELLRSIKSVFKKYESKINLLVPTDSEEAINFLKKMPISVLVADLLMLEIDDLELLAYMSRHHPTTPCIVSAAFSSPELKEILGNLGIYRFLEKPFEPENLLKIIADAIKNVHKGEPVKRLSIIGILKLLQEGKRDCTFEINSQTGATGSFFLVNGELCGAKCGDLQGEEAAIDILGWEKVSFNFKDLPAEDIKAPINLSLEELIAKAPIPKKESKEEKKTAVPKANLSEIFSQAIRNAELGNTKSAQNALAKILKIKPKSSKAWLWFARTADDFNTINIALTKALAISPNDAEIAEEIKKLKSAVNAGCREDSSLRHCFFCWAPIINEQTTCHYCDAHVDIEEEFFQSMFFSSSKEPDLKLIEESLQRFTKASNSDPKNVHGHFLIAMAHVNMNHWVAALEALQQANSIDPNHPYQEQLDLLADFVDDLGDFAQE